MFSMNIKTVFDLNGNVNQNLRKWKWKKNYKIGYITKRWRLRLRIGMRLIIDSKQIGSENVYWFHFVQSFDDGKSNEKREWRREKEREREFFFLKEKKSLVIYANDINVRKGKNYKIYNYKIRRIFK